jgi:glycosyltransferase involved in cell wall biosynthesis
MPRYLAGIDILVNPSLSESETFCVANIEAMALGIPLVSFGTSGQSEYLVGYGTSKAVEKSPNSILAIVSSAQALAAAASSLIENFELRENLGRNAKELIRSSFTSFEFAKDYVEAIVSVTLGKKVDT